MVSDRNRKIQDRAYEIWVEGGRQDGTSDHNWAQAEHEIGHHDHPATHSHPAAEASEPPAKSGGKTKTAKSSPTEAKPAKTKAPKDKAAKAAPEKDKKSTKGKTGDPKPRSKK